MPRGVSPAEIFQAVRHIAAKEGHVPNVFKSTVDIVLKDGWMLQDAYSEIFRAQMFQGSFTITLLE